MPSDRRAYIREWKRKNSTRLAAKRRADYSQRYGVISRENERRRADRDPYRYRAQVLRGGLLTRSREFGLPFDSTYFSIPMIMVWLANTPKCDVCGVRLDIGFKHDHQKHDNSPSFDRVQPKLGYVRGNVQLICWRCNNLKRDATPEELEQVAAWLRKKLARNQAA